MKKGSFFPVTVVTIYIVVLSLAFLFSACGPDTTAPSIDTSTIPQTVFFNDTGFSESFLFLGRATDNTNVELVEISADNGSTWKTAVIDDDPPNKQFDVEWSYLASSAELAAGMYTVLVRATDQSSNVAISDPVILASQSGSTIGSLLAVFATASSGDVIGLSTGLGMAYGDSTTALTIPINVDLTVQGSGYGSTVTSGGLIPLADPTATILESDPATASLFSVDADLTLKNLRLLGADSAIRISGSSGSDPQLSVEECLFDRQAAWAVFAEDDDNVVNVEVVSSIVDASQADSAGGAGGFYLANVSYEISGSDLYFQSTVGSGAGVLAVGSTGTIDASIFEGNALGVWASSGVANITSCDFSNIFAAAYTTNGINLTGGPGEALIRRNTIDGNSGYGLRVGGEMDLILRNNAITNNELSGVLIDSELDNPSLSNVDMGTSSDKGNNLFDGNEHPQGAGGQDTQVFVTLATSEGSTLIPANWNYWGVPTREQVNQVIIDGNDNGGRATLAIGSFWPSDGGEVGP